MGGGGLPGKCSHLSELKSPAVTGRRLLSPNNDIPVTSARFRPVIVTHDSGMSILAGKMNTIVILCASDLVHDN